ncbi:MAG: hypothetical protein JWO58_1190, partial [Chitinophagaceae bacterium]|nr:hypothetical protein [Chitinophagaceae bacterium]
METLRLAEKRNSFQTWKISFFGFLVYYLVTGYNHQLVAQTLTNYTFAASSGTFTALSGATTASLSAGNTDNGDYNSLPIGFNFIYMGTTYTTLSASTNGWLSLGSTVPGTGSYGNANNLANGSANSPRPIIAPLWDDINVTGGVSYLTAGNSPNRTFTIQYLGVKW